MLASMVGVPPGGVQHNSAEAHDPPEDDTADYQVDPGIEDKKGREEAQQLLDETIKKSDSWRIEPPAKEVPKWFGVEAVSVTHPDRASSTVKELAQFQAYYGVHPGVVRYFIERLALHSIEEWCFAYEGSSTATAFRSIVESARAWSGALITYPFKEAARLAMAWKQAHDCHGDALKLKRAPTDEADEDVPLPTREVKNIKERFWKKYNASFGHDENMPGDRTISKIVRELERKTLKPPEMDKVTSVKDESGAQRIRKDMGHGLQFMVHEVKVRSKRIEYPEQWLDQLTLYTNALALAGAGNVMPYPVDANGERRIQKQEDPPYLFTQIPWQQMKEYVDFVKRQGTLIPYAIRLDWMKTRHTRNFEMACRIFRESESKPFGMCLHEAEAYCVAIWQPTVAEKMYSGRRTQDTPRGSKGTPRSSPYEPVVLTPSQKLKSPRRKEKALGKEARKPR